MSGPLRRLAWRLEAAGLAAVLGLMGALPLRAASTLGGCIGRLAGRFQGRRNRRAEAQLRLVLPELDAAARRRIVAGMWDNVGRVAAEFAHLPRLRPAGEPGGTVELVGAEHLERLRDDGIAGLFVTAHLGNWELLPLLAKRHGLPAHLVYRRANNPFADALILARRGALAAGGVPKGSDGARLLLRLLRSGAHVGVLVDQRLSDGVEVPFFGRPAKCATAWAELALRYRLPVVPVRTERLGGARFRVTLEPPLPFSDSGDRAADVAALVAAANRTLERWIRERPEQWLWLHRRWPGIG